jgi:hypothetical protein
LLAGDEVIATMDAPMPIEALPGLFSHRSKYDSGPRTTSPLMWMVQMLCAISGHEYLMHVSPNRIFLRCAFCHRETPGWSLD